jgi:lysozyme
VSNLPGIDISNAQGAHWPWPAERGRISFAMAKATEGLSYTDPDFAANWAAMLKLNRMMPRFSYHFFHAREDPAAQAERFVATVKEHGLLPGDNFVMDLETADGMAPEFIAGAGVTFLHAVNELAPGHRVLAYTYPAFAQTGACAGMDAWHLWIANYQVRTPHVPPPWTRWTFWQTGESPVDTDVFAGTEAELLAFCRMPKSR